MVDDAASTPSGGSSSNQTNLEQKTSKNASPPPMFSGKRDEALQRDDGIDLEKGIIKATNNGELQDLDAAGFVLKDVGEDDDDDGRCRVCHLVSDGVHGSQEVMQLGCHCKEDLATAHRDCAEAWFKTKGNRICEICGATAQNIVGEEDSGFMEQWNDAEASNAAEPQARCWQSLSLCNFFLACMVVTFILLWLFRVTIS